MWGEPSAAGHTDQHNHQSLAAARRINNTVSEHQARSPTEEAAVMIMDGLAHRVREHTHTHTVDEEIPQKSKGKMMEWITKNSEEESYV